MKFECGDVERALEFAELMPEAREHLKHCSACRREYRLWNEISAAARELHEEWDTPALWSRIRSRIEAEPKPVPRAALWHDWRIWSVAAALILASGLLLWRFAPAGHSAPASDTAEPRIAQIAGNRDFLTEQALKEVEKNEAAYRQSIDKLSQLAAPALENPVSAAAVNYREKLLMLDSAIAETRTNLNHNRFNTRLQLELAGLYREKQQTLKELLTSDRKN